MTDLKTLAEELVRLTSKDYEALAQILKEEYGIEQVEAATPKLSEAEIKELKKPDYPPLTITCCIPKKSPKTHWRVPQKIGKPQSKVLGKKRK